MEYLSLILIKITILIKIKILMCNFILKIKKEKKKKINLNFKKMMILMDGNQKLHKNWKIFIISEKEDYVFLVRLTTI